MCLSFHKGHANLLCIVQILVYVLPKQAIELSILNIFIFTGEEIGFEKLYLFKLQARTVTNSDSRAYTLNHEVVITSGTNFLIFLFLKISQLLLCIYFSI